MSASQLIETPMWWMGNGTYLILFLEWLLILRAVDDGDDYDANE
jgi:hypothetical protein